MGYEIPASNVETDSFHLYVLLLYLRIACYPSTITIYKVRDQFDAILNGEELHG